MKLASHKRLDGCWNVELQAVNNNNNNLFNSRVQRPKLQILPLAKLVQPVQR